MARRLSKVFMCLALLTTLSLRMASSQAIPIELGIDFLGGALTFIDADVAGSFTQTDLQIPTSRLRAGFFVSDIVSLEPQLLVLFRDIEDVGSASRVSLALTVPVHFTRDRRRPQGFVNPGLGWTTFDSEGNTTSQVGIGTGVGVKLPFHENLAVRIEAGLVHFFETDELLGANQLSVLLGFSFLTR